MTQIPFWPYTIPLYIHIWIIVPTCGVPLMIPMLTKYSYSRKKQCALFLVGVNRRAHSEPVFSSLCVLSVSNVYMYNIGLLVYKYHHGLPPNILDMFEQNSSIHHYDRRQSNLLHVPSCRTELGKSVFRYKAVIIWNEFYKNVCVDIKIDTFKQFLKLIYLTTQCRLKVMLIITGAAHGLALKKCQSVGCTRDICIDDRN